MISIALHGNDLGRRVQYLGPSCRFMARSCQVDTREQEQKYVLSYLISCQNTLQVTCMRSSKVWFCKRKGNTPRRIDPEEGALWNQWDVWKYLYLMGNFIYISQSWAIWMKGGPWNRPVNHRFHLLRCLLWLRLMAVMGHSEAGEEMFRRIMKMMNILW